MSRSATWRSPDLSADPGNLNLTMKTLGVNVTEGTVELSTPIEVERSDDGRRPPATGWLLLALAALYVLTGRLGLSLAHYQGLATLVWAPTGLSLAALLLFGRRLWPGVLVGAAVVNLWAGVSWPTAAGIAIGNTLEAVVGAFLLERVGFDRTFGRVRDVVRFLTFGALGCTMISATIGLVTLWLTGGELEGKNPGVVWTIWWLGDVGGAVTLTPFLLLAIRGRPSWSSLIRNPGTWLLFSGLVAGSVIAFCGFTEGPGALLAAFLPFPFLAWAGGRLGPRAVVTAAALTILIATIGTAHESGPFLVESAHASLMLLWAYGVTVATTGMTLAASIAERDQAEELRRIEAEGRLETERRTSQVQRQRSLGALSGGVAHDFNNILASIRLNAEVIEAYVGDQPDGKEVVQDIVSSADRAAELCRQLLAYAGLQRPVKATVQLPELIQEAMSLVDTAVSSRVTIQVETNGDTPKVEGDRTLLQRVVLNLLLNAAEAIDADHGTVTVCTDTRDLDATELGRLAASDNAAPGHFVYIEVRDDGKGMDSGTAESIFEPFATTKFHGRGLGLASVLGTVRSHRGAIEIESAPGAGTTVRVYLPTTAAPAEVVYPRDTEPAGQAAGRCVIVCDDEPQVVRLVSRMLAQVGYRVLSARNGQEAVDRFRQDQDSIDAVVLDVVMPVMDGVQAARHIREMDPNAAILLMSAFEPEQLEADVAESHFLRKPFSRADLINAMQQAMAEAGTRAV